MIENCLKCLLTFGFDLLFANFLISNLVCVVWRIIWDTQDLYLKSNLYLNSAISVLIYFALSVVVKIEQIKSIQKHQSQNSGASLLEENPKVEADRGVKSKSNWKKKFKLKLFILLFSFANINHWRGIWNFTIHYTNESVVGIFTVGALSFMGLIAMKRLGSIIAVPFCLDKDCKKVAFQVETNSKNLIHNLSLDQGLQVRNLTFKC